MVHTNSTHNLERTNTRLTQLIANLKGGVLVEDFADDSPARAAGLDVALVPGDEAVSADEDEEGESRLTEPYVTKKERGTGLGLAIVKKIMEDHEGELVLGVPASSGLSGQEVYKEELFDSGAVVTLVLPLKVPSGHAEKRSRQNV